MDEIRVEVAMVFCEDKAEFWISYVDLMEPSTRNRAARIDMDILKEFGSAKSWWNDKQTIYNSVVKVHKDKSTEAFVKIGQILASYCIYPYLATYSG